MKLFLGILALQLQVIFSALCPAIPPSSKSLTQLSSILAERKLRSWSFICELAEEYLQLFDGIQCGEFSSMSLQIQNILRKYPPIEDPIGSRVVNCFGASVEGGLYSLFEYVLKSWNLIQQYVADLNILLYLHLRQSFEQKILALMNLMIYDKVLDILVESSALQPLFMKIAASPFPGTLRHITQHPLKMILLPHLDLSPIAIELVKSTPASYLQILYEIEISKIQPFTDNQFFYEATRFGRLLRDEQKVPITKVKSFLSFPEDEGKMVKIHLDIYRMLENLIDADAGTEAFEIYTETPLKSQMYHDSYSLFFTRMVLHSAHHCGALLIPNMLYESKFSGIKLFTPDQKKFLAKSAQITKTAWPQVRYTRDLYTHYDNEGVERRALNEFLENRGLGVIFPKALKKTPYVLSQVPQIRRAAKPFFIMLKKSLGIHGPIEGLDHNILKNLLCVLFILDCDFHVYHEQFGYCDLLIDVKI